MTDTKIIITRDEAYDAMVDYLDRYYSQVLANDPKSPGDLACVLSEMMLLEFDETPMDPAVTEDYAWTYAHAYAQGKSSTDAHAHAQASSKE